MAASLPTQNGTSNERRKGLGVARSNRKGDDRSMRIAAISDIHANLVALDAVLADIERHGVDITVNLGDILSGPLWPRETAERLRALTLPTLRGNHERQLLTLPRDRMGATDRFAADMLSPLDFDWLRSLPETLQIGEVHCCHGTPQSDLIYFLETVTPDVGINGSPGIRAATADEVKDRLGEAASALVLCGHTHVPRVVQAGAAGTLIVNPGSVGVPAFEGEHPHRHVVQNGAPHARWALLERNAYGRWSAALQATAYDYRAAARQATSNGRPDWARALTSGYWEGP